ncbi:reverse transcriptase domain-containing protein [Tanacetum coccineum]
MLKYAMYLKSILTNKSRLEEACTLIMNERCSAVLLNKLPLKENYLRSFTIPCQVNNLQINNALADLGANLENYSSIIDNFINDSDIDVAIRRFDSVDTAYSEEQKTVGADTIKNEHLYSATTNEIDEKKPKLKGSIAWKMSYIKGISPSFCTHKILMEDDFKLVIQPQRRLNPKVQDVVTNEIVKFLDSGLIFPISDSSMLSLDLYDGFYYYKGLKLKLKMKKAIENLAADHLSRLENPHMEVPTEREIADEFHDEHLMMLKAKLNDVEPCEIFEILAHRHYRPTRGHHSAFVTRRKVYESRFFWPNVFKDAKDYMMKCNASQISGNISSKSETPQNNIQVEAQALPTNDARVLVKFLRGLFVRFGVPKALISDRGTNFCNSQLERALAIKRILERSVGYNLKDWSEKLNDALWAFRTTYKIPASKNRLMQLNELAELKQCNMDFTTASKNRDKVLLLNSRLKMYSGKLKSKWYGLNIVKTVYPYGAVEITYKNEFSFKVSGQRLKKYYEGNIDKEDEEVIEFEGDAM